MHLRTMPAVGTRCKSVLRGARARYA
jgi:hypothetical protein